jgi:glutamine synthetase
VDVCNYFDKNVERVTPTLGWEQEYFVIDEGLFNARPDLVMCGRTVFGHNPAKTSNWKTIILVLYRSGVCLYA